MAFVISMAPDQVRRPPSMSILFSLLSQTLSYRRALARRNRPDQDAIGEPVR